MSKQKSSETVKVVVRCRPLNKKEIEKNHESIVEMDVKLGQININHPKSTLLPRQCLLHRPGFQHLIAAALAAVVILFCCSVYYLLSWHRCPNPNSNNKI